MIIEEQINKLSLEELVELNKKIVKRINLVHTRVQEDAATDFSVGDEVFFITKAGSRVEGNVVKVNRKTVKVSTNLGMYKVSPTLLKKV